MGFVHLHLHTEYSLLEGFAKIDSVVEKAKQLNMEALAITDYGNMFGAVDFYQKAKRSGIKPIIGCEVYVETENQRKNDHLVLLCKNEIGYKNLIKLVSFGYTENFYYKPRLTKEQIRKRSEGLIAISAYNLGEVNRMIQMGMVEHAKKVALFYKDIFGSDYYLEIQHHGLRNESKINSVLARLAKEIEVELVATNDVHYTDKEDAAAHDILLCIQTGKTIKDTDRIRFPNREFYFKTEEEMRALFQDYPKAIDNTVEIANKCHFEFTFGKYHLPKFSNDATFHSESFLRELAMKGLKEKFDDYDKHLDRLEYELNIINDMGYNDYFLIVWDFVRFAKEQGIFVGPGRGSGGGSLVGYALNITTVNPIEYGLIFERFLNPERITMPDFDIDFEDDRRQEVIDYVNEKYGETHVAQIITFGTLAARAAIRDVGRVMGLSYAEVDKVAKAVPFELKITIDQALQKSPELRGMLKEDNVRQLIENARKIEGVPRHTSTHAAGVVISEDEVSSYVPLYMSDGLISTQFTMKNLEKLGLVKMDFLGLRNLSIIKNALKNIEITKHEVLDINRIDTKDKKTFDMLSRGDTLCIFQLESRGMKTFFRELKPRSISDIMVGISLYRPGPMESIPVYLRNKKNPNDIKYVTDELRDILADTYGCLVYQEQVMQIFRKIGGYSYAQSDLVRRAISKKDMAIMKKEREGFIHGSDGSNLGATSNGLSVSQANAVFDDMVDFANYAFNKSHAASYAIVAYQSAYLKANYTKEFMASIMSSVMSSSSKLARYIKEARRYQIEILGASINKSYKNFSVEGDAIRYGLKAIKNVGNSIIKEIIRVRDRRAFHSFDDFLNRMDPSHLNKKAIECMIKAGVFDEFGVTRRQLLSEYELDIDNIHKSSRRNAEGQLDLFGNMEMEKTSTIGEYDEATLSKFEKEVLGVYLSSHPLSKYDDLSRRLNCDSVLDLKELDELSDNKSVKLIVSKLKLDIKGTKQAKDMGFVLVEDEFDSIEVIAFSKTFAKYKNILMKETFLYIKGRLSIKADQTPKIILDEAKKVDRIELKPTLYIRISSWDEIDDLKSLLGEYNGRSDVVLYNATTSKAKAFKNITVNITKELIQTLSVKYGKGNVLVKWEEI